MGALVAQTSAAGDPQFNLHQWRRRVPKQLQDNGNVRHVVHGVRRYLVRELASLSCRYIFRSIFGLCLNVSDGILSQKAARETQGSPVSSDLT